MSERLVRSAGLIGAATFASRVLGLIRDVLQARIFGAGDVVDAFTVATRIPTLLRDLFAEGAMSAAFVPTFTRQVTRHGREAAWRLGSQVVNVLLIVTGALVVLGIVFAGPITSLYAGGYGRVAGKLELTTFLTQVNMPFLTLVAIAAAYMGMLNGLKRFFMPSFAPALYNVVFILCAVLLTGPFSRFGWPPILSLAVGMLLGGLAQILAQWPVLRAEGYRHSWTVNTRDPALREVLLLMGPGTIGVAAAQINLLINTSLATHAESGAAAVLGYAFRLMYMPIGIFGVSVATAAIPDLARHAAREAHADMRSTLSSGLRLMLVLSVPASVGLMALAPSIVELLFEYGHFGPDRTIMTAAALLFYAPGIVGYSIVKIASPSFYSLGNARTPIIASAVTIGANVAMNLALVRVMGFRGLALGTAIAANINAGLLLFLLAPRIGGIDGTRVWRLFVKILVASIFMGLAAYFAEAWLHHLLPGSVFLPRLIRVSGGIAIGLAVLTLASFVLQIEEFGSALRRVLARIKP